MVYFENPIDILYYNYMSMRKKSFRKERLEREAAERKEIEEFIASQKQYSTKEKAEQLIKLLLEGEE